MTRPRSDRCARHARRSQPAVRSRRVQPLPRPTPHSGTPHGAREAIGSRHRSRPWAAEMGTEEAFALAAEANRFPPELLSFDARGRRLDEVRFHSSYHALMEAGMRHRIHSVAWTAGQSAPTCCTPALLAVFSEVEQGTMCPLSMTYAAVPALRHAPALAEAWLPKLLGGRYDASVKPFAEKRGVTLGMAMTEKQGGSDVRATRTQARPAGPDGRYTLLGHKWFCSAPMCDGFLTLAQAPGRPQLFPGVTRHPGGGPQRHPPDAAQGQARQSVQRLGGDRVPRCGGVPRRGGGARHPDHHRPWSMGRASTPWPRRSASCAGRSPRRPIMRSTARPSGAA